MNHPSYPSVRIGSESLRSPDDRTAIFAAARGAQIAWQETASAAQVNAAVAAARAALPAWRALSCQARGSLLHRIAALVEAERGALVARQMQVNGKPLHEADLDVSDVAACFSYYAGLCLQGDAFAAEQVALPDPAVVASRSYEAIGVAALVVPWNFPMVTTAWKLAPALAAGCTVVLKPSELSSPVEHALFELLVKAGIPAGVVNLVNGGATVGAALVGHDVIEKISFTGSTAVGRQIMRAAAERLKRVTLELGGKSALIVREDADLALAVQLAVGGAFTNAGQMCSATSRILVDERLYERFMREFESAVQTLVVAPPDHPACGMGPLISHVHRARVQALLAKGIEAGARVAFSGRLSDDGGDGFFMAPVVMDAPREDNPLWREEIFGPVACVRPFGSDEEALASANATEYGLVATVLTTNAEAAALYESGLRAGLVWINTPQLITHAEQDFQLGTEAFSRSGLSGR